MPHALASWLLVIGFAGAGLMNTVSTASISENFRRWGYPTWWGRFTGLLEILTAVLVAIPDLHKVGIGLGSAIIVVAIWTVVRHRDFTHLLPLAIFAVAIAISIGPR